MVVGHTGQAHPGYKNFLEEMPTGGGDFTLRELQLDPTWSSALQKIHAEHQQFANPKLHRHVYSWYRQRTATIVRLLKEYAPDAKRLLDIGCAQGTIAISLAEMGYDVTGNDIRDSYLSYARQRDDGRRVKFVCENFVEYKPELPFDAVIFTEVIEHVIDHASFLRHIFDCLRPGGIAIVTTPNYHYIKQPLPSYSEVNLEINKNKEFSANGSDHFYLFSKTELADLFSKAGFELLTHRYFLPFIQDGIFRFATIWKFFPSRLMEFISRPFENSRLLCAQQLIVVRRP